MSQLVLPYTARRRVESLTPKSSLSPWSFRLRPHLYDDPSGKRVMGGPEGKEEVIIPTTKKKNNSIIK